MTGLTTSIKWDSGRVDVHRGVSHTLLVVVDPATGNESGVALTRDEVAILVSGLLSASGVKTHELK